MTDASQETVRAVIAQMTALCDHIESHWDFFDEKQSLATCIDWIELRQKVTKLKARAEELDAALVGHGWQPITTAPGDAFVLVYVPVYGVMKAVKAENGWLTMSGATIQPTHWMPLPAPPQESTP